MSNMEINFSIPSPTAKNNAIKVYVDKFNEEKLLYKFIIGCDGIWDTIEDFTEKNYTIWTPNKDGKYIVMVQAKKMDSTKPFDYVARTDYIIGEVETKLINQVSLNNNQLKVGDKLHVSVESSVAPVVYKYWICSGDNWELIKDYSADNTLSITVKTAGKHQLLVECKMLDSKNNYDDFYKVDFNVDTVQPLEIKDFKCLSTELLAYKDLIFQVDAQYEDNRMILYKFIKIDANGKAEVIQDYSTKRIVSYVERKAGDYKILCLAKDMYSQNQYDDRALIAYTVKPYKEIKIISFTSDLISPQIVDSDIELRAVVDGGRKLLYRYIIDGNYSEDSDYIKEDHYTWKPQKAGKYKITLWVKDESFKGKFEESAEMEFLIDEVSNNEVKIKEVIMNKEENFVRGENIHVSVMATGGSDLRYAFKVLKEEKEIEWVDYSTCNWVNFTPEGIGSYTMEIMVKDKYSKQKYDCHEIKHLEVMEFIPAEIDYVLMPSKEIYMVGDKIKFDIITQRTNETLIKYVLKINKHTVEETDYIEDKSYLLEPRCRGEYILEIMAKDKASDQFFDSKKVIRLYIKDAVPVANTKILRDKVKLKVNEGTVFTVKADGGRDLHYEFYLMEQGQWNLVQKYSKINYYSFMPYKQGTYKLLALVKSFYNENSYEDYDMVEFKVE
ncbi:MAG: triple tyrosine motif-containing protein [Clostridiales bacterium]|nr:triple tyrosine motif-containing protein [Clostridiales bacterium]